ncbi:MAG: hypothetical protein IT355_11255 [Gemmatimonadaceae bacterium]|nr:hypothetical protein [Gemmatimonadaceae bacterium]
MFRPSRTFRRVAHGCPALISPRLVRMLVRARQGCSRLAALAAASVLGAGVLAAQTYTVSVQGSGAGAGNVAAPAASASTAAISCDIAAGLTTGTCSDTWERDSVAALTATAAPGSIFTGWSGACAAAGTAPTCSLSALDGPQAVTAAFEPVCTVAVSSGTGGSAAVIGGGETGACGRTVTIAASPAVGHDFAAWTVGGGPVSTDNPYSFTLTTSDTWTATFAVAQCTLTIGTAVGGSASLTDGTLTGDCGRSLTVVATPDGGYRFSGWSDGSRSATYTLALTAPALTLTPSFTEQCTLTLDVSPVGAGSASLVAGDATGDCGRTVTASASPTGGYLFTRWSDGSTSATRAVLVTSPAQLLTAEFTLPGCTLTLGAGTGGNAVITDGAANGACGRSITVQATPDPTYSFSAFTEGGSPVSTSNPWTFTLTSDRTIVATFASVPLCNVSVSAGIGGSATLTAGTPSGPCGRSVTVEAAAASGFRFAGWSDGSTVTPYTFVVSSSLSLTATFVQQCTLTLAASPADGGTATLTDGTLTGDCGRTATATATPTAPYTFVNWSDGSTSATRVVNIATPSQALTANFAQPLCTLVLDPPTGGTTVITSGSASGVCGRSVTVQATPASGYAFTRWSDGSTVTPYTLVLSAPTLTLGATFTPQCALALIAAPVAGGTVTLTDGSAVGDCGRTVTALAAPATGYVFRTWSDGVTTASRSVVVTVPSQSLTATFEQPLCTLTLTSGAGGSAAITSGTATGVCGRSVTIQATPDPTFSFNAFTEGSAPVSTSNPWTFTLTTDRTIAAAFAAVPQCNLTIGAAVGGAATITTGSALGPCGRSVTVQATPSTGYRFGSWSDGTTVTPYVLTMSSSFTITPAFVQQCTLVLAASPSAGGTATLAPGSLTGDCGRTATATATPTAPYLFTNWSDGATTATRAVTISTPSQTLTANFAQPLCTLVLSAGAGGTATITSGAANGVCGRSVTVQATPNTGFRFASWSDGTTVSPYTVVLTAPTLTLTASFTAQCTLTLAATPAAGGTVSLSSGSATGDCGRTVTALATPASGYEFRTWSDGVTTASRTVAVTVAAQTLTATFAQPQCTLTLSAGTGGTVRITGGSATGICGRNITMLATPNATYTFGAFTDGTTNVSTLNPFTLSLTTNRTIVATFVAVPQCALVLGTATGGTATLTSGTLAGACGRSVTVQATAGTGYRFARWSDSTTTTPYTFTLTKTTLTLLPVFVQQCAFSVAATPTAGGTAAITTGGAAGDCGRTVTVVATPASGYRFTSWSDGNTEATRTTTVTTEARSLTATFALIPQCALTLGTGTGGTVALTAGTLAGACGRAVTLQATPASGFRFKAWSDSTSTNPYTLTLTATTLTLTPEFAAQCTLVLTAAPVEGGSATLTSGTLTGDCGRSVTALARPNTGYAFTGWSEASAAASYTLTVTQSNQPLSALFAPTAAVRVVVSGAAGRVARVTGGTPVCALVTGTTETACTVVLAATELLVAEPEPTTGFIGWRGVCSGRGTCTPGEGDGREVKALFLPVRSIAADVAALDLLTGTGLSLADRELLDQTGNGDGVFNLGDLLAHLDRTKQVLTPAISSRILQATTPLSQPTTAGAPTRRP